MWLLCQCKNRLTFVCDGFTLRLCLIELGVIMKKMSDVFGELRCEWDRYEGVFDMCSSEGAWHATFADENASALAITAISAYDNHIELLLQCIPHLQFNDPELLAKVKEAVE